MVDINKAISAMEAAGFIDVGINPELDLFAEIDKLKKEKLKAFQFEKYLKSGSGRAVMYKRFFDRID